MDPILELKNVTVELGGDVILRDVNLNVYPKDTIVLIGMSGSGKSVLLKTMAGLFHPKIGYVKYHGHTWDDPTVSRHDDASKIGMQFQQSALFDEKTVYENVAAPLREHTHFTEDQIRERVRECLTSVALEKFEKMMPHELSGGMQLRLGVARAIALRPEILFMDDPTAGLDPVRSDEMAELILNLKKQFDSTLIVVTHDIMRAYQFAGRIILVANKTILETGSAEQTQNHPNEMVQQFLHGWLKGPLTQTAKF